MITILMGGCGRCCGNRGHHRTRERGGRDFPALRHSRTRRAETSDQTSMRVDFRHPKSAIVPSDNPPGPACIVWGKQGDVPLRGDPPKRTPALSKPEGSIGPGRNPTTIARGVKRRRQSKLGDLSLCGDAPDLVGSRLGKPEGLIWPCCDLCWSHPSNWESKLAHLSLRGDTPDLVELRLGKPERAIRSNGDPLRPAGTVLLTQLRQSKLSIGGKCVGCLSRMGCQERRSGLVRERKILSAANQQ